MSITSLQLESYTEIISSTVKIHHYKEAGISDFFGTYRLYIIWWVGPYRVKAEIDSFGDVVFCFENGRDIIKQLDLASNEIHTGIETFESYVEEVKGDE